MKNIDHLRIQDAADILGVSSKTLRRWEASGKLIPQRSVGNQRYYTKEQVEEYKATLEKVRPSEKVGPLQQRSDLMQAQGSFPAKFAGITGIGLTKSIGFAIGASLLVAGIATPFYLRTFEKNEPSKQKSNLVQTNNFPAVLAAATQAGTNTDGFTLRVNSPSIFDGTVSFANSATFLKDITAPNVIYSITAGTGIGISSGQNPTITNTGITSLTAGSGIGVSGSTITNSDLGSSQSIFKTIAVTGQTSIAASSNTDTLTFAGSGITITTDATNKKLTFTGSVPDYTLSGWTKTGTSVGLTTITDSVLVDGITFGNATVTNGKKILPSVDLGSDMGATDKRFNNLWVANINSNSSQSFSGQTTFSYAPTDATIAQASILVNPTTSSANGQLIGLGIAGYQRALIDAEGDMILGYNSLTSAPATAYPLTIYGHNGTNVSFVDASGNGYFAGNIGIGTTAPTSKLQVNGNIASQVAAGAEGLKITNSGTTAMAFRYASGGIAYADVQSDSANNKFTSNSTFDSAITGWDYGNALDDQFTTNLAAGSVNGTAAEPGPGTRTVTDTATPRKISITSSALNIATGANNSDGISYSSQTRVAGKTLLASITSMGGLLRFGFNSDIKFSGSTLQSTDNVAFGSFVNGTTYQVATVMRTTGQYIYIKGGAFTNWTLLWIRSTDTQTTPAITTLGTSTDTVDNIKIPTNLWLPTPLAYDTFGSAGATTTETSGPDSQTTSALTWTGGTKAAGTMAITPTLGADLLTDGALENWSSSTDATSWTEEISGNSTVNQETSLVHAGNAVRLYMGTSGTPRINQSVLTNKKWYQATYWARSSVASGSWANIFFGNSPTVSSSQLTTSYVQQLATKRADAATLRVAINWADPTVSVYADDVTVKELTLASLLSTVPTTAASVIADANVTVATGTQAGLVLNLDSTSSPANFRLVYLDQSNIYIDDVSGGTYTNKQTTAMTGSLAYSAGATLRAVSDGTNITVYYNNVLVGTITTMAANTNTNHGLFSTYASNTFDNFTLWNRSGYTDLPDTNITVTNDTTTTYGGSPASMKVVTTTSGGAVTQSINVGDTATYTLSAAIYTTGAAVTSADAELQAGAIILPTTYTSLGSGWYRMKATVTGVASAKAYGVLVHAGKTVYLDNLALLTSTAVASTFNVQNTLTGLGQMTVESTTTLNTGLSTLQGLIVKGALSQTANLQEWQSSTGTILGAIDAYGGLTFSRSTNSTTAYSFNNSAGTSVLNIDTTNGRVGIGTTAPTTTLSVNGNMEASQVWSPFLKTAAGGAVVLSTGAANQGNNAYGGMPNGLTILPPSLGSVALTIYSRPSQSGNLLAITSVTSGTNVGDLFNVGASGKVGIGTTAPASKLDITGTGTFAAAGTSAINTGAHTVTLSGANPTTYATFYGAKLGAMTLAGTNANQTVTDASTLYIDTPVQGANVTIGTIKPINTATGAYLSSDGVWHDTSSRTLKENFTELNMNDILDKIDSLEVTSWNYKATPGINHIGPVAEDFYSAFSVGNDPQHLAALDTAGVALAGIKALITKVNTLSSNTPNSPNLTDVVLQTLEAQGAVTFKANVEFQGPAMFRSLVEYFDTVIFHKDVNILGTATFNSDTAGMAVIPTTGREVNIVFDKEYAATPIVTTSPLWNADSGTLEVIKQLGTYVLPKQDYIVANVTTKGFTIILEQPATVDLKFSWTAVSIKDVKTVMGAVPTPTPSPVPTVTPSASPSATPEATATPSETPTP